MELLVGQVVKDYVSMLVETWGQTEPDATAVAQQTSVIASLLENPDQVGKHYNRSTWTVVHTGHTGYTGIATPTGLPLMVPFRETSPPPPPSTSPRVLKEPPSRRTQARSTTSTVAAALVFFTRWT